MKKNSLTILLSTLVLCLTSCGGTPPHEHTFSNEWSKNESSHWHAATCEHTELTKDLAEHTFGTNNICTTCGYEKPSSVYYVVTFDTNGGNEIPNQLVNKGETVTRPETPTKSGYLFDNWYVDSSFTTKYDFTKAVITSFTLYAKWTLETYSITYHIPEGADKGDNPDTYNVETEVVLKNASFGSMDFDGWFLDEELTNKITKISKGTTGNLDLYADFNCQYEITYVLNGGVNDEMNPNSYSSFQDVRLYAPEKEGYAFVTWHFGSLEGPSAGTGWGAGTIAGDVTLVAEWSEAIAYDIAYVLPAGATHSNPITYTVESEFSLSDANKEHSVFEGWFKTPAYNETDRVTAITKGHTGSITLYGKFSLLSYSITYELNGGEEVRPNKKSFTVEDTVALYNPNRNGYYFLGWYEDKDFSGDVITGWEPGEKLGNVSLFAKWSSAITYSISYKNLIPGEDNPNKDKASYTIEDDTYIFKPLSRKGYKFNSWYLDEEFETPIQEITKGVTRGDLDLYPSFSLCKYTITYETSGCTHSGVPYEYTVEDNVTLESPTKFPVGYGTFVGWHLKKDLSDPAFTSWNAGTYAENLVLYAEYRIQTFSITYVLNGGTNDPSNPTGYTINDEVVFKEPTYAGHDFYGWYKTAEFKEDSKVERIEKGSMGNVTLYARFETAWYLDQTFLNNLGKQDIGLLKQVKVNGLYHLVRLIGVNEDKDKDGNTLKSTWEFVNVISDANGYSFATFFNRYDWGDYTSSCNYPNSSLRKVLNGEGTGWFNLYEKDQDTSSSTYNKPILNMLPDDLVNVLKKPNKIVTIKENNQYVETSVDDKLFCLTPKEMGFNDDKQEKGTKTYTFYTNEIKYDGVKSYKEQVAGVWGARNEHLRFETLKGYARWSYAGVNKAGDGARIMTRSPVRNNSDSSIFMIVRGQLYYDQNCRFAYNLAPGFCL